VADDYLLDVRGYIQEDQAIRQHCDEHGADHGAEDRADSAEQTGAATECAAATSLSLTFKTSPPIPTHFATALRLLEAV
jgi:hypothetical protein